MNKLPSYYPDIKPAPLNHTITIQEPNALKDTPNNIPSTRTCSNERQEKDTDHQLDLSWFAFNASKIRSLKLTLIPLL